MQKKAKKALRQNHQVSIPQKKVQAKRKVKPKSMKHTENPKEIYRKNIIIIKTWIKWN